MAKLTVEEEELTESYILYELARKVLEIDLVRITKSPVKLKDPYIQLLESSLHHLSKQMYTIKMNMKQLDLKILHSDQDDTFSEYTIFFRGYVLTIKYLNAHLKNQVSQHIASLFVNKEKQR